MNLPNNNNNNSSNPTIASPLPSSFLPSFFSFSEAASSQLNLFLSSISAVLSDKFPTSSSLTSTSTSALTTPFLSFSALLPLIRLSDSVTFESLLSLTSLDSSSAPSYLIPQALLSPSLALSSNTYITPRYYAKLLTAPSPIPLASTLSSSSLPSPTPSPFSLSFDLNSTYSLHSTPLLIQVDMDPSIISSFSPSSSVGLIRSFQSPTSITAPSSSQNKNRSIDFFLFSNPRLTTSSASLHSSLNTYEEERGRERKADRERKKKEREERELEKEKQERDRLREKGRGGGGGGGGGGGRGRR